MTNLSWSVANGSALSSGRLLRCASRDALNAVPDRNRFAISIFTSPSYVVDRSSPFRMKWSRCKPGSSRTASMSRPLLTIPRTSASSTAFLSCSTVTPASATSSRVRSGVVTRNPIRSSTSTNRSSALWSTHPRGERFLKVGGTVRWISVGRSSVSSWRTRADWCDTTACGSSPRFRLQSESLMRSSFSPGGIVVSRYNPWSIR